MGFWDRLNADYARRTAVRRPRPYAQPASATSQTVPNLVNQGPYAQPPGGFSYGTNVLGGPLFVDRFQSRRAPSPWQLVEQYTGLAYAMVQRNAMMVSRVPLRLYADGSRVNGGRPRSACDPIRVSRHVGRRMAEAGLVSSAAVDQIYEVRTHPILNALDHCDPYNSFSRKQLVSLITAQMDAIGQAFIVPEGRGWDWRTANQRRKKGPPEWLWVLYPQYVIPFRDYGANIIRYWQYFRDQVPYDAAVWFRHSISLRDPYGSAFAPLYAGNLYYDQEERFSAIWDQVLGIGPRPNIIASAKDANNPPGEAERKRFAQDMQRQHAAGNAGGLLVLNGAYDVHTVSYQGADLAAKAVNEYSRNNAATIMGQPPTYYTTDTNLANLEAADAQYAKLGIEPRCDTIASVLTNMVRQWDERLFFKFDPPIPEDDEKRARVIDMKLKNGSITINQANEEERWPAVPWGDEPWISGTLVQPSMAREKHEQGIAQGQASIESQRKRDEFELQDEPEGGPMEEEATDQREGPARSAPAPDLWGSMRAEVEWAERSIGIMVAS